MNSFLHLSSPSVTSFVGLSGVFFFPVVLADSTESHSKNDYNKGHRDNRGEMEEKMEAWIIQQSSPRYIQSAQSWNWSCLCRRMFSYGYQSSHPPPYYQFSRVLPVLLLLGGMILKLELLSFSFLKFKYFIKKQSILSTDLVRWQWVGLLFPFYKLRKMK